MKATVQFHCDQGDHDVTASVDAHANGIPFTSGYGIYHGADGADRKACYACCAERDRADMIATGRATLYLVDGAVTNWPGSLSFPVGIVRASRHNWARVRYDFRFKGPDGATWAGTQYGDYTQIAHCRRVRA